MAAFLSFSSLVEAIARSVAEAQDQVERYQVSNLLSYFDEDGRPRGIDFRVPSQRADAKPGDEDFYTVPLLALLSINVLKIKDVETKFSVDLGELTDEGTATPKSNAPAGAVPKNNGNESGEGDRMPGLSSPMKTLNVSTTTGRGGGKARVTLRVEGSEPSEGAARLLDYLAQIQGVYPQLSESASEEGTNKD
jgi:hypothetical protein